MKRGTKVWIHALIAAAIGGAATGAESAIAAVVIAPEAFNLDGGLSATMQMATLMAILGAAKLVFAYLKESPLPSKRPEER